MYFKIGAFIPDAKVVAVYTYEKCDAKGNILSTPTADYLEEVNVTSPIDAQILISQLIHTANKYGLLGRSEKNKDRPGLYALPSKYDEGRKITSRYRLYYWVLNNTTIIIGNGCFKPDTVNGKKIKVYQEVPECEAAANELSLIGEHLEGLARKGEIFIEKKLIDIDENEILEI